MRALHLLEPGQLVDRPRKMGQTLIERGMHVVLGDPAMRIGVAEQLADVVGTYAVLAQMGRKGVAKDMRTDGSVTALAGAARPIGAHAGDLGPLDRLGDRAADRTSADRRIASSRAEDERVVRETPSTLRFARAPPSRQRRGHVGVERNDASTSVFGGLDGIEVAQITRWRAPLAKLQTSPRGRR